VRETNCETGGAISGQHAANTSHVRQLSPPAGRNRKLFTEVLKGGGDKRYKIMLKAKD